MIEYIEKAYKKMKSSVYYDKTQLILRDKVVDFESDNGWKLQKRFSEMSELLCGTNEEWNEYKRNLLASINVLVFPKKICCDDNTITMNTSKKSVVLEDVQYFFDCDVEVQILGVLWCLLLGVNIDNSFYEHSYGNRMKKNIINKDGMINRTPYLFQPYFEQYEGWRDKGLDIAQEALKKGNDIIILTLDFTRYFYSLNVEKKRFDDLLDEYSPKDSDIDIEVLRRSHDFIYEVISVYNDKYKGKEGNANLALPIGFFPSCILSNWYLDNFDKAICNRWNPLYYGRYVDDIIIVEKIEKSSDIYLKAEMEALNKEYVLDYYLCNCNAIKSNECTNNTSLLYKTEANERKNETIYHVNTQILNDEKGDITIKNEKVKIFYFKKEYTDALIDCFRKEIARNKSEFRFLPEDEGVLQQDDYSEIYKIKSDDTLNKLRGVDDIELNKFALSKFLGKYLRISTLIDDSRELKFEKEILKIFDNRAIIDNYTTWEKIIEVLVLDNKLEFLVGFVERIIKAIINIRCHEENQCINVKKTLLKFLRSSLARPLALSWGGDVECAIKEIYDFVNSDKSNTEVRELKKYFEKKVFSKCRNNYCKSRMCDKNAIPLIIDAIIDLNAKKRTLNDSDKLNLSRFSDCITKAKNLSLERIEYKYFPYTISPQDIEMCLVLNKMLSEDGLALSSDSVKKMQQIFVDINGFEIDNNSDIDVIPYADLEIEKKYKTELIKVGNDKKTAINIAIANTKLYIENFEKVLLDKPDRSYERYLKTVELINIAIKNKVDILILPEAFLPFEWISIIARTCAKIDMAIVVGIEHIKCKNTVYNLTATILPYKNENYSFSHLNLRNKVHYSPEEKRTIKSYGFKYNEGENYNLFNWKDIWFPVYCCFELTSIVDRAIFMSLADMLIAVEWNHDVNYYSNIIESLSRDLHCYCIQVNTSDYGDSRIMRPSKTENKDIVRTKGGKNNTILTDHINFDELRKFQVKGYELQKDDKKFKPIPPQFDYKKVRKKIQGVLWEELKKNSN